GELTHFVPQDNVYVYFRHNDEETVMVMLNGADEARQVGTARYDEFLEGSDTGIDILTGRELNLTESVGLQPESAVVVEIR
ncbi:MAG: alpha-amylase, partial [Bacteroidetes bacterium]|nr:alpha-amylase [Bacteroidota bacterium]